MIKDRFKFYFQNSCNDTAVTTFSVDDNNGKQRFTVTGYTVSDYFDVGDELEFNYDGNFFNYTIIDITGNAITMAFDENTSITNVNTYLQFSPKIECFPYDFYKGKFEYKLQDKELFYRLFYSGRVSFRNDDYQYLYDNILSVSCCQVRLKVYKLCDSEYSLYYRSVIKGNAGTWDYSGCMYTVEIPPSDKYECILENGSIEKNIYDCDKYDATYIDDDGTVAGFTQSPFFEYYVRPIAPIAPGTTFDIGDGGALFIQVNGYGGYIADPNTGNAWTLYAREKRVFIYEGDFNFVPPTLSGFILTNTEYNQNRVIGTYTKQLSLTECPEIVTETWGTGGDCIFTWGNSMAIYDPINDNCIYTGTFDTPVTFTRYNGVRLDDSLALLVDNCNEINYVTSDFFQINPIGDTTGYFLNINYVTGNKNYVTNIHLSEILDVVYPNNSTKSAFLYVSFSNLMKTLNNMFNTYWFIDAQYRLRIEHKSWFEGANVIENLTVLPFSTYNKNKSIFTFIKEETPQRERFKSTYAQLSDFIGTDIIYNNGCSNSSVKQYDTQISTDIFYIRNTPAETFSPASMVMFACDIGADAVLYENGIITGISLQNNHLSWANLQDNYHRNGRPLPTGNMNFNDVTFDSYLKRKKQVNQKILNCCVDMTDTIGTITTELGSGDLIKLTENLDSNIIDLELNV